jgi:hypothetical protein
VVVHVVMHHNVWLCTHHIRNVFIICSCVHGSNFHNLVGAQPVRGSHSCAAMHVEMCPAIIIMCGCARITFVVVCMNQMFTTCGCACKSDFMKVWVECLAIYHVIEVHESWLTAHHTSPPTGMLTSLSYSCALLITLHLRQVC